MNAANLAKTIAAVATAVVVSAAARAGAFSMPSVSGLSPRVHQVADQGQALIDVNSASEEKLRTLPGVGPAKAQAIIAGRPYKGKDDLVKKNVLSPNVFDGIKDRIVARQK